MNLKTPSLFPETPPILFTFKHFRVLDKLVARKEILQKDLLKATQLDKTTVSEIKSDLIRLGWCKDVDLGSGKEILIKLCKLNEIKSFIRHWKFLKQSMLVRPHSIILRAVLKEKPEHFIKAVKKLSLHPSYRLIISHMNNNEQYTLETEYGKVNFYLNGMMVIFYITGFILPVTEEDLDLLEEYITEGIQSRVLALHSLLKEHFEKFRIEIFDCIYLKSLHLGIITKKDVSKCIQIKNKMEELKMFCDESIYGCDEIEAKGKIDKVLNKVKVMLNELFELKRKW